MDSGCCNNCIFSLFYHENLLICTYILFLLHMSLVRQIGFTGKYIMSFRVYMFYKANMG